MLKSKSNLCKKLKCVPSSHFFPQATSSWHLHVTPFSVMKYFTAWMQHVHIFNLSNDSRWLVVYFLLSTSVSMYGRLHGLIFHNHVVEKVSQPATTPPPSVTVTQCVEKKNICERPWTTIHSLKWCSMTDSKTITLWTYHLCLPLPPSSNRCDRLSSLSWCASSTSVELRTDTCDYHEEANVLWPPIWLKQHWSSVPIEVQTIALNCFKVSTCRRIKARWIVRWAVNL